MLVTGDDRPPYLRQDTGDLDRDRLRRAFGCDGTAVLTVEVDREAGPGEVVVAATPRGPVDAAAVPFERPWVRVEALGWDLQAVRAARAAGLLDRAGGVEVEVEVAAGRAGAPSLADVAAELAGFELAALAARHTDPVTGETVVARAAFVRRA